VDVKYILGTSVLLQLIATFLALKLIRVTRGRRAWLLMAIAFSLIAFRQATCLFRLVSGDASDVPDLSNGLVAVAVSVIMIAGIASIGPLFLSIKRSEEKLKKAKEAAEVATEAQSEFRTGNA
jgi:hypothetical protein